ncbi:MAG: response regulator transcription factor [Gemmatimonadaceae bacterium]|nr:response regulator transcription factor [Gemmatimonadaceae bacterium]
MSEPHVLIVEDSALVTDALRILFEGSGFRVTVAASLADARALPANDIADLMLLDVTLEDGDGIDLLIDMRAKNVEPETTVALTGYDDPLTRQRAIDAGCADVLVKPVPVRELLRIARSYTA